MLQQASCLLPHMLRNDQARPMKPFKNEPVMSVGYTQCHKPRPHGKPALATQTSHVNSARIGYIVTLSANHYDQAQPRQLGVRSVSDCNLLWLKVVKRTKAKQD